MTSRITLSRSARPAIFDVDAIDENGALRPTSIAGEHALTIYLDKREIVTLMTLGAAPEHLVIGYLSNQRLIGSLDELAVVQVDWETGAAAVATRAATAAAAAFATAAPVSAADALAPADAALAAADALPDRTRARVTTGALDERLARRTVTSGCGQGTMFGDLVGELLDEASANAIRSDARLRQHTLYKVLENVRRHESIYKQAGAVHGCALCSNTGADAGDILFFVEDVGRHNAVDAIAGWMLTEGVAGDDKLFYTTGRLTSEMVIKCAQMRIPMLLSRSGVTQMGYELARQLDMTMIGRCQGRHYLLFTGAHRFDANRVDANCVDAKRVDPGRFDAGRFDAQDGDAGSKRADDRSQEGH